MFGRRGESGRGAPPEARAGGPPYVDPRPTGKESIPPENILGVEAGTLRGQAEELSGDVIPPNVTPGGLDPVRRKEYSVAATLQEADRLDSLAQRIRAGDKGAMHEARQFFQNQRDDLEHELKKVTEAMSNEQAKSTEGYRRYTAVAQAIELLRGGKRMPNDDVRKAIDAATVVLTGTSYGKLASDAKKFEKEVELRDALISNLDKRMQ